MITPKFHNHQFEAECLECNSKFSTGNLAERHARKSDHVVVGEYAYKMTWKS